MGDRTSTYEFWGTNATCNTYAPTKTEMGNTEKAAHVGRVGGGDEQAFVLLTPNPAVLLAGTLPWHMFPACLTHWTGKEGWEWFVAEPGTLHL